MSKKMQSIDYDEDENLKLKEGTNFDKESDKYTSKFKKEFDNIQGKIVKLQENNKASKLSLE